MTCCVGNWLGYSKLEQRRGELACRRGNGRAALLVLGPAATQLGSAGLTASRLQCPSRINHKQTADAWMTAFQATTDPS